MEILFSTSKPSQMQVNAIWCSMLRREHPTSTPARRHWCTAISKGQMFSYARQASPALQTWVFPNRSMTSTAKQASQRQAESLLQSHGWPQSLIQDLHLRSRATSIPAEGSCSKYPSVAFNSEACRLLSRKAKPDTYSPLSEMSEDEGIERVSQLFENLNLRHGSNSLEVNQLNLTGRVTHGPRPHTEGHFAKVYKGEGENGDPMAVKMLRLPSLAGNETKYEVIVLRFYRELVLWAKLRHCNIARLLGYIIEDGNISLISHWHQHGNLAEYLQANPEADRANLIRDVVEGTNYLHSRSPPFVHGDLKAANILVSKDGVARLTDFGISKQIGDLKKQTGLTTTSDVKGTLPWMAPELHIGKPLTTASDVYSCAGLFIEVYCPGKIPYHYMAGPLDIIVAKSNGKIPCRSHYPEMEDQDALWDIMRECWAYIPGARPSIGRVLEALPRPSRARPTGGPVRSPKIRPRFESNPFSAIGMHRRPPHGLRNPSARPEAPTRAQRTPNFGVELAELMRRTSSQAPSILEKCCVTVEHHYLSCVGIYWNPSPLHKVKRLKMLLNHDLESVDLSAEEWLMDMNIVSGAIKCWLRELPEPLLTLDLYESFIAAAGLGDLQRHEEISKCIRLLPDPNYYTLEYLMDHLCKVQNHAGVNQMTASRLSIVFGPILLRPATKKQSKDIKHLECKVIEGVLNFFTDTQEQEREREQERQREHEQERQREQEQEQQRKQEQERQKEQEQTRLREENNKLVRELERALERQRVAERQREQETERRGELERVSALALQRELAQRDRELERQQYERGQRERECRERARAEVESGSEFRSEFGSEFGSESDLESEPATDFRYRSEYESQSLSPGTLSYIRYLGANYRC